MKTFTKQIWIQLLKSHPEKYVDFSPNYKDKCRWIKSSPLLTQPIIMNSMPVVLCCLISVISPTPENQNYIYQDMYNLCKHLRSWDKTHQKDQRINQRVQPQKRKKKQSMAAKAKDSTTVTKVHSTSSNIEKLNHILKLDKFKFHPEVK